MAEDRIRARVIVVSGSHSKAGKTLLIERLIPLMGTAAAVKISSRPPHPSDQDGSDTDTSRYLHAGASQAFLLDGTPKEILGCAADIARSGRFDTVFFETNRFSEMIDADLRFFVKGGDDPKDNAAECERRADIVIDWIRGVA